MMTEVRNENENENDHQAQQFFIDRIDDRIDLARRGDVPVGPRAASQATSWKQIPIPTLPAFHPRSLSALNCPTAW